MNIKIWSEFIEYNKEWILKFEVNLYNIIIKMNIKIWRWFIQYNNKKWILKFEDNLFHRI